MFEHSPDRSNIVYPSSAYSLGSIDPSLYKHSDVDDDYDIPDNHIGRIWFAVEYERETEKLLVTLIKAKNLPSRSFSSHNQCDPFVRWVKWCICIKVCFIVKHGEHLVGVQ